MTVVKQRKTFYTISLDNSDVKDIESKIDAILVSSDDVSVVNKVAIFETVMIHYIMNKFIKEFKNGISKEDIIFIKISMDEEDTIVSLYYNHLEGDNSVINGFIYSKTTLNDYE